MLRKDLYNSHAIGAVSNAEELKIMDFTMNLEILRGCRHTCSGCFVNRVNKVSESELSMALKMAREFSELGLRFKECVISPTDFFSAANTQSILLNPTFQELFKFHNYTNLTCTGYFEKLDISDIERVFDIIDDPKLFRDDMHFEFFVPLNAQKILDADTQYEDNHFKILEWFENNTPRLIDWSFATNIYNDPILINNYAELTTIIRDKYNTIIEFLPSFFRTNDHELIKKSLKIWSDFTSKAFTHENRSKILFTASDLYHAGSNQFTLNFKDNNVYLSPFIYEQILYQNDMMHIKDVSVDGITNKIKELQLQQYKFSEKTNECNDCQFLATCVGRNILSIMEYENINNCIYDRKTLDLFNRFDFK